MVRTVSDFDTQHARQEIERPAERARTFSPSFVTMAVIVILLFLAFFLYPSINGALTRAKTAAQLMELKQLELAVVTYIETIGEHPPNATLAEIQLHVQNSKHRPNAATSTFDNFTHDLSTIDVRETLAFWLGGEAWQAISSSPDRDVFYEFSAGRLTDVDNDGWPEYTDDSGRVKCGRGGYGERGG